MRLYPVSRKKAMYRDVPGNDSWRYSPNVWHNGDKAKLNGNHVENKFYNNAMPVLRESSSTARSAFGRSFPYPKDLIHPPSILPVSCRRDSMSRY